MSRVGLLPVSRSVNVIAYTHKNSVVVCGGISQCLNVGQHKKLKKTFNVLQKMKLPR